MTSTRRAPGLALAAILAVFPSPPGARADPRCDQAKARTAERVRAEDANCDHDWDCVPFAPQYFGCELYRDRHAWTPPAVLAALASACADAPPGPAECTGKVGACVQGRCTARAPSGVDCEPALEAARARAGAPTLCEHDSDCALTAIGGTWFAVARGFWEAAVREEHAIRDRCTEGDPFEEPDPRPHARCAEGLCRAAAPALAARGPRVDRECVLTAVGRQAAVRALAKKQGRVFARFVVDDQGAVRQFSFDDDTPADLAAGIVMAIRSCRAEPALDPQGRPMPISVALPLSFR